jgi:RecB family endonuclease NucS
VIAADKLRELDRLQQQEQRVYEKFLISLEGQVRQLLPQINQPELLNQMMAEKSQMMEQIQQIETGLGPLRREIGQLSSQGKLVSVNPSMLEQVKTTDLNIIDLITRISKTEQELTNRIKEHMDIIKERLQQIGQERQIKTKYGGGRTLQAFKTTGEAPAMPSQFDSAG